MKAIHKKFIGGFILVQLVAIIIALITYMVDAWGEPPTLRYVLDIKNYWFAYWLMGYIIPGTITIIVTIVGFATKLLESEDKKN